ncbi:MAG: type II secretion system protein GspM [Pseudomonadota bacterium]
MMRPLRPVESRALALGLLLAILAGVYAFAIDPVLALYRDNRDRIDELSLRLGQHQRLAAERPALEDEHARLSRSRPAGGYYLTSESEALAVAELQAYVKQVIESSGGGLVSIQPILSSAADTRGRVKAQIRMQGPIKAVRDVLYRLESGSPWLLVDEVELMQGRSDRRKVGAGQPGTLDVRFNLTGFMRGAGHEPVS